MRHAALALLLSLAACEAADSEAGGTTGEDPTMTAAESSSSGGETEDEGESSGGESSSGGMEMWGGAALLVREVESSDRCSDACGASACIEAVNREGQPWDCNSYEYAPFTCTCGDFTETAGPSSTHGVSTCFLAPDTPDPSGFEMNLPPRWEEGDCDAFCGSVGMGACALTMWSEGYGCSPITHPSTGELVWDIDLSGSTSKPADLTGDGGVLRFVCEL